MKLSDQIRLQLVHGNPPSNVLMTEQLLLWLDQIVAMEQLIERLPQDAHGVRVIPGRDVVYCGNYGSNVYSWKGGNDWDMGKGKDVHPVNHCIVKP